MLQAQTSQGPQTPGSNPDFYDFCRQTEVTASLGERAHWSAPMVQKVLTDLIESPNIKHTAWAAYPVSYKRMTAARDKERCGGALSGKSLGMDAATLRGTQLINHHLADVMTRWLVYETKTCTEMPLTSLPKNGLCGLMARQKSENFDTISSAVSTSGVYISSHIALSLSAVAADDDFWDQFPDPKTRRTTEPVSTIPAARFWWLSRYKPHFDLFNQFLADNLKTVAYALSDAKLIRGNSLNIAAHVGETIFCRALPFGAIRDRAFDAAVSTLKSPLIIQHPMLKSDGKRLGLQFGKFNFSAPLARPVIDLEEFTLLAVASPASRELFKKILGGRDFDIQTSGAACPIGQ